MDAARVFLAILGLSFAIAGIAVASAFDRITGVALLVVGAFLLILPVMSYRSDD